jgi:hypothetical protein
MSAIIIVDHARLTELETTIENGLETFVEVGHALLEIRDSRLYRDTHDTFEGYCIERWSMSNRHANRLIQSAEVIGNLGPIGPIPDSESVARPLAILEPDQQREAWQQALLDSDDGKPTAETVKAAAQKIKAKERQEREERSRIIAFEKAANAPDVTGDYQVICSDIRDANIEHGSIDAIVTDPPYEWEYIETFRWLAEKAVLWLKNGGSMLVMSGQAWLPRSI